MIGERIRFFRKYINWKQTEFAKALGISQTHVSKIENGSDLPSSQLINRMCALFGINKEWLTTGEGEILSEKRFDSNLNSEKQQLKLQILNHLDNDSKESNEISDLLYEVMSFCNMAKFFENHQILNYYLLLSPIITDLYELCEYLKAEYPKFNNVVSIKDYEDYLLKQEAVDEIKEIYIDKIVSHIHTIVTCTLASSSSNGIVVDHLMESYGSDDDSSD